MPLRKRGAATTKNQCEKSSARTRCWRPSLPSRDVPGDFFDASRPVWLRETTRRASAIPGGEVTDKKGRWQCRYSEGAVRIREQKKYDRVVAFGRALPRMRQAIDRDMRLPGLPREKVMACIMRILSTCFMRPGSEAYAKENGSYGIATLQNRHASVHGDTVRFHYRGEAGKEQVNELRDRGAARQYSGGVQVQLHLAVRAAGCRRPSVCTESSVGRPRRDCRSRLPSARRCRRPGSPRSARSWMAASYTSASSPS